MLDSGGYRLRASCICVRDAAEAEVLLVTSRSHPSRWVVPGGGIEVLEDEKDAALREVMEEAGAEGTITRFVANFQNDRSKQKTAVFVLLVSKLLDEWEDQIKIDRKRCWFSVDEAMKNIKPSQRQFLTVWKKSCLHR